MRIPSFGAPAMPWTRPKRLPGTECISTTAGRLFRSQVLLKLGQRLSSNVNLSSAKGKSVTEPETTRPGQRHDAYSSSTHSHNSGWVDGEIGSSNSAPAIAPASSNLHQRIVAGTTAVTGSPRRRVRIVICACVPGSRNRSEKNPIPARLTSMLCPLHGGCPLGFVIRSSAENDVLAYRRLSTCLVGSKAIGDCTCCI